MQTQLAKVKLPQMRHQDTREAVRAASERWLGLCDTYLPITVNGTFWRFSRTSEPGEPEQGWKLHISATVVQACGLFTKVAPFLTARGLRFKAPESLNELININCGLSYGYKQVGKFITVYPSSTEESLELADALHKLTAEFISITVPFDEQYLPDSSVFYRYGAYLEREIIDPNGIKRTAIKNLAGELVYDDSMRAVPEWLSDPFLNIKPNTGPLPAAKPTPFSTTYMVFKAITQRGKGGTYQAIDLSANEPRMCIVKEGRRHGETFWNGQDGYYLVRHEYDVLTNLGKNFKGVPRIYSSFEADGNFYFAMEYVNGKSLHDTIKFRSRRLTVRQLMKYAREIIGIIEKINSAGWIWNDCKPENLLITPNGFLRPIDFENAYPVGGIAPFNWKSLTFSKHDSGNAASENNDLYSFAAVMYFLATGRNYNPRSPVKIEKLRGSVPKGLAELIHALLAETTSAKTLNARDVRIRLESIFTPA